MWSQERNRTTEEAKTPSPFPIKGLLHWISPWGQLAPLSGQISSPLLAPPPSTGRWVLEMGEGVTDSTPPFPHTLHFSLICFLLFNHLYLTLFSRSSTIFRIKAAAPLPATLSRHVTSFVAVCPSFCNDFDWAVCAACWTGQHSQQFYTGHERFTIFKAWHRAST